MLLALRVLLVFGRRVAPHLKPIGDITRLMNRNPISTKTEAPTFGIPDSRGGPVNTNALNSSPTYIGKNKAFARRDGEDGLRVAKDSISFNSRKVGERGLYEYVRGSGPISSRRVGLRR